MAPDRSQPSNDVVGLSIKGNRQSNKVMQIPYSLTKLGATGVQRPPDSHHMGIRLTAGKVLYRDLLVDLNRENVFYC